MKKGGAIKGKEHVSEALWMLKFKADECRFAGGHYPFQKEIRKYSGRQNELPRTETTGKHLYRGKMTQSTSIQRRVRGEDRKSVV